MNVFRGGFEVIENVALLIQLRAEHVLADISKGDIALEPAAGIHYRENGAVAGRNCLYKPSKGVVHPDGKEIRLKEVLRLEEGEDSFVGLVGKELT